MSGGPVYLLQKGFEKQLHTLLTLVVELYSGLFY